MGWKSTIRITRAEAISAIQTAITKKYGSDFDDLTEEELESKLSDLDVGDDMDLPYYGYNFTVLSKEWENYEICSRCEERHPTVNKNLFDGMCADCTDHVLKFD